MLSRCSELSKLCYEQYLANLEDGINVNPRNLQYHLTPNGIPSIFLKSCVFTIVVPFLDLVYFQICGSIVLLNLFLNLGRKKLYKIAEVIALSHRSLRCLSNFQQQIFASSGWLFALTFLKRSTRSTGDWKIVDPGIQYFDTEVDRSYFSKRIQCFKIGGYCSQTFNVLSGISQRSHCRTLLFDLCEWHQKCISLESVFFCAGRLLQGF